MKSLTQDQTTLIEQSFTQIKMFLHKNFYHEFFLHENKVSTIIVSIRVQVQFKTQQCVRYACTHLAQVIMTVYCGRFVVL